MTKILVLHGPNLNLLGTREPEHYGQVSLKEINDNLESLGQTDNIDVECRQSNAENDLVDWVQQAPQHGVDFIIINPAAFTHTSIAIRDAMVAVGIPFVEVHLSNVHQREPFRKHSYFSDVATAVITGMGHLGYEFAYRFATRKLNA
jgi:3-dehydroquinate dehydratase-2